MTRIIKIAHRGVQHFSPENTLDAFQETLNIKCEGIELDVHLSSDKKLIVFHDQAIDKMTNGKGLVNTLPLSALKSYWIKGTYKIPTLQEVLDLIDKRCIINIEIKSFEAYPVVILLIEEYISTKN